MINKGLRISTNKGFVNRLSFRQNDKGNFINIVSGLPITITLFDSDKRGNIDYSKPIDSVTLSSEEVMAVFKNLKAGLVTETESEITSLSKLRSWRNDDRIDDAVLGVCLDVVNALSSKFEVDAYTDEYGRVVIQLLGSGVEILVDEL